MTTALAKVENKQLDALRQIASQATDPKEIRERLGSKGKMVKYTDPAYVIRTLNQAFGWDWDFVADSEELLMNNGQPFEIKVRGTLTVRLNGQAVIKTQYGCQPIEMKKDGTAPVSIGDCYKGAASDAMKKCASLLGIALDLYDSDSDVNTGKKTPTHVPPEAKPGTDLTQPIRNIKPTNATRGTQEILKLINTLKWDGAKIRAWVEENFNYAIVSSDLGDFFDSLDIAEQRKMFAALKAAQ